MRASFDRRRPFALAGALLLGAVIAFPLGAIASHQFAVVPDSNLHRNDIDAMRPRESGMTYAGGGARYATGSFGGTLICRILLPNGAVVPRLRADVSDTPSTGNAQCSLRHYTATGLLP